jgi:hypothetical protein
MPNIYAAVRATPERLAFFRWGQQRAQSGETVGGHYAERHQFGQRFLDLRPQQAGAVDDFIALDGRSSAKSEHRRFVGFRLCRERVVARLAKMRTSISRHTLRPFTRATPR